MSETLAPLLPFSRKNSIRFDSREIDLRGGRKIHGENSASGDFFYFVGRTAEMANLYASTVFDFNENLRWVSLSLSLSLSSHSADRPLPRQINGYMAYRKVVFADEQANGQTNGQMHARVRIGGFSAAKFIAPTYSRESTGGPGWNEGVEDIDYVYGSTMEQYFPLAHARASERTHATPVRRNAENW